MRGTHLVDGAAVVAEHHRDLAQHLVVVREEHNRHVALLGAQLREVGEERLVPAEWYECPQGVWW